MITPNATSAMAGFGFIYSFYMLLLVIEVWLVFRPDIVERVNTNHGICHWVYLMLPLIALYGANRVLPISTADDH
jgi:hypothetical protein